MCDILDRCARRAQRSFPKPASTTLAQDTAFYLAHTEEGLSMRRLASATGRHPSTVMRAIRRVEERRDDPLFEIAIDSGAAVPPAGAPELKHAVAAAPGEALTDELKRAAKTVLRRLSEPGAFLLVATGAGRGGIFCAANGHRKPIAMMDLGHAADFLRRDWIKSALTGATSARYTITEAGRSALKRILSEEQTAKAGEGFAEAQTPFAAQHVLDGERRIVDSDTGKEVVLKVNLGECPVGWLSRRKTADGSPFLSPAEVEAAERMRSDFEAAQIGPRVTQDWEGFLTAGCTAGRGRAPRGPAEGPTAARDRVLSALSALGPGLADVALRVCCFIEGLESCEKRMGWSARSGKVVLKLALQRLVKHYGLETAER